MIRGLFIGRFQPFHLGHLEDIKNALKEVDELIIGIGSSQESFTKDNPFTCEERKAMITNTLKANSIKNFRIYKIPDFHNDKKWIDYIKNTLPFFDVVYTGNKWTERCLKKYKVKMVKMLKGISSTIIRNDVLKDKEWKNIVPKEVVDYIEKIKGVERVKEIILK